jgi:hypothetical protein
MLQALKERASMLPCKVVCRICKNNTRTRGGKIEINLEKKIPDDCANLHFCRSIRIEATIREEAEGEERRAKAKQLKSQRQSQFQI